MTEEQAREHLEYIRRVMEETRRATVQSNPLFFLWGVITWLAVLLTYGFGYVTVGLHGPNLVSYIPWIWRILPTAGTLYTIVYIMRQEWWRKPSVSTFSHKVTGYAWLAVLPSSWVIGFVAPTAARWHGYELHYVTLMAVITALLAMPLFVMGGVYELRVFKYLALAFWICAAAVLLVPVFWSTLVYGVIVGTGLLIAGEVLRRQARAHHGR